jgi:hypothetical protein
MRWNLLGEYRQKIANLVRTLDRAMIRECDCDKVFVVNEIGGEVYDPEKVPPCPRHGQVKRTVVIVDI